MNTGVIRRIGNILDANRETSEQEPVKEPEPEPGLFECSDCESTYVHTYLVVCPECGESVESIPTERDLGMGCGVSGFV